MPTAVLHLRPSRDTEVSDSLDGQEADCRRRAAELGADRVVVFREVVCGGGRECHECGRAVRAVPSGIGSPVVGVPDAVDAMGAEEW